MPDFKDPEEFDSGEQGQSEKEEIYLKKESIAAAFSLKYISHDNRSRKNDLTALEQLILFEFDAIDNPEIRKELPEIKRDVISISKDIDYFDYEMFEREGIDEKAINIKIAKYLIRGYITDDHISDTRSLTSLEQIIYFKYGSISWEKFKEVRRKILAEEINLKGGSVMSKDEYTKDRYRDARQY